METTNAQAPVLQIVHISDLHFHVGAAPQHDQLIRCIIAAVSRVNAKVGQWFLDYWEDGRAGHASDALVAFECFLTGKPMPNASFGTPSFSSGVDVLQCSTIPTWLVDTGDLASVGDHASVDEEKAWVDRMAKLMGAQKTVRLYGNHDAWPDKFPFIASNQEIDQHRTNFRNTHFAGSWPMAPESIPIGSTGNRIDLYGVNSVIHDRYLNSRAHGQVRRDRHWGGNGSKDQLVELESLVVQRSQEPGRAFRVLLSHHPIHYPPPAPRWVMSLRNANGVASQLINRGGSTRPLAHLVLSGHTHRLYPGHGTLPPNAGTARHTPLGQHQLQLIVGSLSKAIRDVPAVSPTTLHEVDTEPHQCQVLRFYEVNNSPNIIELRRAVIGRNNGTGRFKLMPLRGKTGAWESTFLNF